MAVNINIPSQVSQTITNGVTDKAPSEDAVFDALALKANTADLGATAFSNDYNDLDNLPTIPAGQVNSDWNATSGVAEILNKPTIPSLTGFVPYTGATSDLNMGTYNLTADHINLNVSPSGAGFVVGSMQWNNTLGSSQTLLKGGNVTLKNGVDLVARIVNKVVPNTTLTKAAYQAVKVSGATGGRLSVGLAQGNTDLNSADTIGLVTETIATNQEGFIITVGQLLDINTTGSLQGETWADGDVLYLSPTVAGKLTNIKPTGATGHIVVMGYVEYAHANHGAIYVKIMNGWELDELHNVSITSPTGGATLQYQASTQLWVDAGIQYTIELVAALTVDFYAPYNMVITSVSNVLNAPTITLQDDNVAYTLGNTIAVGSKVTVTASVASVVNLNITK
jgi:nitrogen fixation protein